ncbi:hypothetical protein N7495_007239 [Penicillium taxi]|uniref:uncharacterized protein n=1 Tax=Penicillium taxi TaxID=168475 RepID=UPI0025458CEA|nr:uncharacterized protein N7495_007239 [Penicillium taxi]KAJ5895548.1 hypothetical protein N7495_007239 [Penicillium taxi]
MNQMNVGGMPGVGGPVGGVQMMNNGSAAPRNDGTMNNSPEVMINNLNTYIYDYFLKRGYYDCARALYQDESIKINTDPGTKTSPGSRDVNGLDPDAMMTDGKDGEKMKIPDDLPRPSLQEQPSSFLLDWFSLFWEFFWAQRKRGNSPDVRQYLQHNQNMMRYREQQQQSQIMRQPPMMANQMGGMNMRRPNSIVPNNLQKTVLQNTGGLSQQQFAHLQKQQQIQMMQQMREQNEMDINGNRPQSPASADNAPSPSKRPRLEGGPVNGQQLAPNGRQGQGMPGQPTPQMLMQNGMQRGMNPAQFQAFQQGQQQKSMQVYAQTLALHHSRSASNSQVIPNGAMMGPNVMPTQTEMVQMPDGQGIYPMHDYYGANGQMPQPTIRPGMQTPNGQAQGNHALQDYQMQLMLLEQQNKRRLMMARQEQDSIARDGQPPMPGQGGLPPGTSPGSRTGTSPNPGDQMKRGTPKMPQTGLPGSPSTADLSQNRASPGSMNLNGGQMPPEMAAQFFPGGPNMRPPNSNLNFSAPQMGQPIPANAAGRMPNGPWQPATMPPQHSPATQGQAGTPQERNQMPPPQAPPVAGPNGRTQPPSPQTTGNAPPTPQQANKPAPKKKEKGDNTRKRPTKKNAAANAATGATPTTDAVEPPPTPTPSTPVTPQHPNSFNKAGANTATSVPPPPTSAPVPQSLVQPDQTQPNFADINMTDPNAFNLDFSALDNPDILESFDFDTFLNTDGDGTGFGFDPNMPYSTDGVETGAADL